MEYIDMHVHTTASDGILSPSEAVYWTAKLGLKGIAITDHDTVDGIEIALQTVKKCNDIVVIPGIEFSTIFDNKGIHILGYFIDHKNKDILNITEKIKNHRTNRAKQIINALKKIGININFNEVLSLCQNGSIGRPHIARILMNKGYVSSIQNAFDIYLDKGRPAYVPRFKLSVEEAINIIENSKGLPVLAHPALIDQSIDILSIIKKGIKGIEVYHTQHTQQDIEKYLEIAKKLDLLITGGSDYHDAFLNGVPTLGNVSIPYYLITKQLNTKYKVKYLI